MLRKSVDCVSFGRLRENQLSSQKVTGPSLTSETCMSAPKTPVSTLSWRSRHAVTSKSKNSRPFSGAAAFVKLARVRRKVKA